MCEIGQRKVTRIAGVAGGTGSLEWLNARGTRHFVRSDRRCLRHSSLHLPLKVGKTSST